MMPAEFLFCVLFFILLDRTARRQSTDGGFLRTLRVWTVIQAVLFVVFTVLVYTMGQESIMIPFGALYIPTLGLIFGVIVRMRETVEAVAQY